MPKKKCEYHGEEHEKNSIYMFYNTRYDVHLYTNADGFHQAMINLINVILEIENIGEYF